MSDGSTGFVQGVGGHEPGTPANTNDGAGSIGYRGKRMEKARVILRNVVSNHAPVFGVISPPFTDVEPFCRDLLNYMFDERVRIYGNPAETCTRNLYTIDGESADLNDTASLRDPVEAEKVAVDVVRRYIPEGGASGNTVQGVFLKHMERFSPETVKAVLDVVDRRGMFVLYWSTKQIGRGQYIAAGILSDEYALAHFTEPGYLKPGAIPDEAVPDIPHNEGAIRIIETRLLNYCSSDSTQISDILMDRREFIQPYVDI